MASGRPTVEANGPLSADVVLWTRAGAAFATVVAKQRARLVPEGEASEHEPAPLVAAERTVLGHATGSLDEPSDLTPPSPRAEVLVRGSACAPAGATARSLSVRLGLARGSSMLLDKLLEVVRAEPFAELPLTWEHAYGGLGFADNPVGVGHDEARLPEVRGPRRGEPAGLGPLSPWWGARTRLLGGAPRPRLEGPVVELAEGVDPAYFQAAPRDQQVDSLVGDEWLLLQHLHASHPLLRARLAVSRVSARLSTQPEPLSLDLARVLVRPSDLTVSFTLRATARLASLDEARALVVSVEAVSGSPGSSRSSRSPGSPRSLVAEPRHAGPGARHATEAASLRATQALDAGSLGAALPFDVSGHGAAPTAGAHTVGAQTVGAPTIGAQTVGAPTIGAQPVGAPTAGATVAAAAGAETPWAAAARAPAPRSSPLAKETLWLDEPSAPSGSESTRDVSPGVASERARLDARPARRGGALAGTHLLGDEEHEAVQGKAVVPFAGGEATALRGEAGADLPGAPWSQAPAASPPRPRTPLAGTVELAVELAAEPAAEQAGADPPALRDEPPAREAALPRAVDPSTFFRREPEPEAPAPSPERQPVKPPRPSMKGAVYGNFKKK